jgi:hypothetical protein
MAALQAACAFPLFEGQKPDVLKPEKRDNAARLAAAKAKRERKAKRNLQGV